MSTYAALELPETLGSHGLPVDVGLDPDNPASVFELLAAGQKEGIQGALLTITGITGGAPRGLGAQMAVLADGRYCGYVSGGCVEAAVASEAIRAIADGRDVMLRFGAGSPFIDIELPCGGGIDILVHVRPDAAMLKAATTHLDNRQPFSIALHPEQSRARLVPLSPAQARSEWLDGSFVRHYHPLTQLLLIGEGPELSAMIRMGRAAGLPVLAYTTSEAAALAAGKADAMVTQIMGATLPALPVDPFTAIVFLLHDRSKETRLLQSALGYDPFYIGALGSRRTQAARTALLSNAGISEARLAQLQGPIGLFGPTRTASALAISVLGQVAEARIRLDG